MSGQRSKQVKARIERNKKTPHYAARRDSFRQFWREFTLFRHETRRTRRNLALLMWRDGKRT